jgi:hypothetical protein
MLPDDIPMLFIFLPAPTNSSARRTPPFSLHFIQLLILLKVFLHHPLPQLIDDLTGLIVLLHKCPQLFQLAVPEHPLKTNSRFL